MRRFLLLLVVILSAFTSWLIWMTSERTSQKITADQSDAPGEAVGGDFTLTDQQGRTVRASDFRGRIMLVFFGFTRCPDICPVTVATLSKTMELLGADAGHAAAIFISVDPERDTPAVMKDYLSNFDPHMVGLTGTPGQIRKATEAYKVYFAKAPQPQGSDYTVDHSTFIYMMGKDGKFLQVFENNADAADIARAVRHAWE